MMMLSYEFGKKISFLGFGVLAFVQLIFSILMFNYNTFFLHMGKALFFGGTLLVAGGYGIMFLERRNILDLSVIAAMGLQFVLELFLYGRVPMTIYTIGWDVLVPILLFAPLILCSLQSQNMPILFLVGLAFAYEIVGRYVLSTLCFKFLGIDSLFFQMIIFRWIPACCDGACALFSITRE